MYMLMIFGKLFLRSNIYYLGQMQTLKHNLNTDREKYGINVSMY